MARGSGLIVVSMLAVAGCGRTDPFWWSDTLADEDTGDGDGDTTGDGDPTGDGDGDTTGDGDGDPTGDGDGDPTGDGDGDPTGDGDGDPTGDGDADDPCEDVVIDLTPEPGNVVFLIDQGSHMDGGNFGGLSRLEAVGAALFDPMQGVAWTWETERRLGLAAFTGLSGILGNECPVLETVTPDLLTAASMEASFANLQPQDDNPVADALTAAVPLFGFELGHVIVVIGRDPDTCAQPNPQQGWGQAVLAAQDAFEFGVETHLVTLAQVDDADAQQFANAGAGISPQDPEDASWSTPADLDALRIVLDSLLEDAGTCQLNLNLSPGEEAGCLVELDGEVIPMGVDGWSLPVAGRMYLNGAACDAYLAGATPSMVCPCG
jgi:hypothetical protein